ncbi:hypothetical protein KKF82_04690 [Patescibacteria group bacterium]|nr:hypothetical protein [Patescibacteria group bacterium]
MQELKTITIREVDTEIYKQFKIECLKRDYSVGAGITKAMELWVKYNL